MKTMKTLTMATTLTLAASAVKLQAANNTAEDTVSKGQNLYGNILESHQEHMLKHLDHNKDGKTDLEEFLDGVLETKADSIIDKYGADYQWWKDPEFLVTTVFSTLEIPADGKIKYDDASEILGRLIPMESIKKVTSTYAEGEDD